MLVHGSALPARAARHVTSALDASSARGAAGAPARTPSDDMTAPTIATSATAARTTTDGSAAARKRVCPYVAAAPIVDAIAGTTSTHNKRPDRRARTTPPAKASANSG